MINQISIQNTNGQNPFSDFKAQKNGYLFATKNDVKHIKNNSKDAQSHKLGISVGATALFVGFGVLALMKGFMPKGVSKNLDKLKSFLEQKIANIKSKKSVTKLEEFYIFSLRKVNSLIQKSGSINNFTSLKDILFQKMMYGKDGKRTFTRKIHETITRFFEKISRNTVKKSYKTTQKKFEYISNYFDEINQKLLANGEKLVKINGEEKPLSYWISKIKERNTVVNNNFNTGFGESARRARYLFMKRACVGMDDLFWDKSFKDIRNFKSKTMYQTFIADDYIATNKMLQANKTGKLRQLITHDINDNYKATKLALSHIEKYINPADRATLDAIKKIRINLNSYKKLSGSNEIQVRLKLNEEISENLQKLSKSFGKSSKEFKYSEDAVNEISTYIKDVDNIISKSSKGELQEILTIYKGLLPRKEYLALKTRVNNVVKSLDKSIDTETMQFFDKLRDLKVGSAPTDILSIVASVGAIGYGLRKAEDKDQKYSVMLKAGIPVIAAVGTSLYCTACLVNGGKAMAVGLLSGYLMNKVGAYVDNFRKEFNKKADENKKK